MSSNHQGRGYSADVRLQLCVNGRTLSIGQLGPDFIILRDRAEYPPTEGEIAMSIDGREKRWKVLLPEGITPAKSETRIAPYP